MRWAELESSQPRLAEVGRRRLFAPGVVLVGTIRRDGTPRISPVEPWLMAGELWLSMLWQSAKAADLERDPRILVHSVVTGRDGADGEVKVRGQARAERDPSVQQQYADEVAAALGWRPVVGRFHLFGVDVADVSYIRYDEPTGDQYVTRWPQNREYVRRGTSATSVGHPEPHANLLQPR